MLTLPVITPTTAVMAADQLDMGTLAFLARILGPRTTLGRTAMEEEGAHLIRITTTRITTTTGISTIRSRPAMACRRAHRTGGRRDHPGLRHHITTLIIIAITVSLRLRRRSRFRTTFLAAQYPNGARLHRRLGNSREVRQKTAWPRFLCRCPLAVHPLWVSAQMRMPSPTYSWHGTTQGTTRVDTRRFRRRKGQVKIATRLRNRRIEFGNVSKNVLCVL